jgi:hypothetical protein
MSVSYYNLFNLKYNFTRDDLYKGFSAKVEDINKSNLSGSDKLFMTEHVTNMYHKARSDLLQRETEEAQRNARQNLINMYSNDYSLYNYFDTFERMMQNRISNFGKQIDELTNKLTDTERHNTVFGSTRTYNEKMLADGSKLIVESTKTNKNGNVEENTVSYKRHKDGKTEPVILSEALKMLK